MFWTILTSLGTGLGTIVAYYIYSNNTLREGVTQWFLSWLNKVNMDKIELKYHSIYIALSTHKNQLNIISFTNEMKGKFCQEYLSIIFANMKIFLENLDKEYQKIESVPNQKLKKTMLEYSITSCFENAMSQINIDITEKLIMPVKVAKQFEDWKTAQLNALRCDVTSVVNDDTLSDNYYKTYKVFGKVSSFFNYVTANFVLLFSNINGAFDNLTEEQLFVKK